MKSLDQQARAILDDAHPTYPYDGSKGALYSVGFERAHSNIMAALMNRDEQIRVLAAVVEEMRVEASTVFVDVKPHQIEAWWRRLDAAIGGHREP